MLLSKTYGTDKFVRSCGTRKISKTKHIYSFFPYASGITSHSKCKFYKQSSSKAADNSFIYHPAFTHHHLIAKFEQSHERHMSNSLLRHLVSDLATHRAAVATRQATERRRGRQHRVFDEGVEVTRAGRPVSVTAVVVRVYLLFQGHDGRAVRSRVVGVRRVPRATIVSGATWCVVRRGARLAAADRGPVLRSVD